jgi:alpha-N-arabinofuranosidase
VALRGFDARQVIRAEVLRVPDGADRFITNTQENPDAVGLTPMEGVKAAGGELRASLPALSWTVIELEVVRN